MTAMIAASHALLDAAAAVTDPAAYPVRDLAAAVAAPVDRDRARAITGLSGNRLDALSSRVGHGVRPDRALTLDAMPGVVVLYGPHPDGPTVVGIHAGEPGAVLAEHELTTAGGWEGLETDTGPGWTVSLVDTWARTRRLADEALAAQRAETARRRREAEITARQNGFSEGARWQSFEAARHARQALGSDLDRVASTMHGPNVGAAGQTVVWGDGEFRGWVVVGRRWDGERYGRWQVLSTGSHGEAAAMGTAQNYAQDWS